MSEVESTPEAPEIDSGAVVEDVELEESSTSDGEEQTTAEPEKPKARGVQKRLDELTRLRHDAERDRDYWRDLAVQKSKQPETTPEPEPVVAPKGKPSLDQFESYEAYTEALTEWKVEERFRAQEERAAQAREAAQAEARKATFQERAQAFATEAEDFQQVAFNPSLPVSAAMAEAIQSSDKGPQLLYHLGKNPQEAVRIASLGSFQAAMELGKLEAKLSVLQPRTKPGAPTPIEPLSGGTGGAAYDPNTGTAADFKRWRESQLRKR